jgi:hypothetical protein
MRRHNVVLASAAVLTAAALSACGDSGGPSSQPQVAFNLATKPAAAAVALKTSLAAAAVPETYTDADGNTLVISRVQLVMSELELESATTGDDCDIADAEGECEELKLGPFLVDLPLGTGGVARNFSVAIAAGSYDEVEFEIHKPESSDEAAFIAANPDFDGVSIRAEGTYNGTPFTYSSDLDVEMEIDLDPPLEVVDGAATDLTLLVDLSTWFRDAGGALLDPASANKGEANEGVVKENVKASLEAFEDDDRDGIDD